MRMSCNGCRVLRKGCSEDCSIRPCLRWIKNPESQANAIVFLAKYYGRAGLMNLINAGPDHLRPAIFRSLLYEACGRIVNPIYGSVGLLWSGSWPMCQAAVEAVLKGEPIVQIPSEAAAAAASTPAPAPIKAAYDIRHVARGDAEHHKISKSRPRFKRPGSSSKQQPRRAPASADCAGAGNLSSPRYYLAAAGDLSHEWEPNRASGGATRDGDSRENASVLSAEASTSHVSQGDERSSPGAEEAEVGLELTLGFESILRTDGGRSLDSETCKCKVDLCLELPAA